MAQTSPKVAMLPYGLKLGPHPSRVRLDQLDWPLGAPDGIAGKTLADLTPDDHLIIPPRNTVHFRWGFGTRAKVSLIFAEPRAVHGRHMRLLRLTHRRFHRILTADETLLAQIPNALFFPFGSTWLSKGRDLDLTKTAMCSLIASAKRALEGHELRHAVVDWLRQTGQPVEIMGRGYRPFADKSEGLAPYRYSVVIENVRERNYFSEKLIDALLCETVPIYWGCPNIGDFFDPGAMIPCTSLQEVQQAIAAMSEADYAARLPVLRRQRAAAETYADFTGRAARMLVQDEHAPG